MKIYNRKQGVIVRVVLIIVSFTLLTGFFGPPEFKGKSFEKYNASYKKVLEKTSGKEKQQLENAYRLLSHAGQSHADAIKQVSGGKDLLKAIDGMNAGEYIAFAKKVKPLYIEKVVKKDKEDLERHKKSYDDFEKMLSVMSNIKIKDVYLRYGVNTYAKAYARSNRLYVVVDNPTGNDFKGLILRSKYIRSDEVVSLEANKRIKVKALRQGESMINFDFEKVASWTLYKEQYKSTDELRKACEIVKEDNEKREYYCRAPVLIREALQGFVSASAIVKDGRSQAYMSYDLERIHKEYKKRLGSLEYRIKKLNDDYNLD